AVPGLGPSGGAGCSARPGHGIASEAAASNDAATREPRKSAARPTRLVAGRAFMPLSPLGGLSPLGDDAFRHAGRKASRLKPLPTTKQQRENHPRNPHHPPGSSQEGHSCPCPLLGACPLLGTMRFGTLGEEHRTAGNCLPGRSEANSRESRIHCRPWRSSASMCTMETETPAKLPAPATRAKEKQGTHASRRRGSGIFVVVVLVALAVLAWLYFN